MGLAEQGMFDVRDVAVVGAGPCGLAAAKYLLAQGTFNDVVVYEQQPEVGGVWNYSEQPSRSLHVPQVSASCPPDPPIRLGPYAPIFPSPLYKLLHANIPGPLMQYSDLAFPKNGLIFPPRETIQEYLVEYSQDVRHAIQLSVQVKDIQLRQENGKDRWDLCAESTVSGEVVWRTFDAVVVASGHYATTFVPAIPNIEEFHEAHPDVITHSKLYRKSQAFKGKKVVVVGNGASGLDIASQIGQHCQQPLLMSVRTATPGPQLEHVGCEEVPPIEEFLVSERGVRFQDGRVETAVEAVVFATGYLFGFPFLQGLRPPLITNGRRVHGLYKDLVYIEHPTLAFSGLPIRVVPFPLAESQAAIVARVWSNLLSLPTKAEMHRWEEERVLERGDAFHVYSPGGDVAYINETYDWITGTSAAGKTPPKWNDELKWMRQTFREAKLKFEQTGRTAKSLEELGFDFSGTLNDNVQSGDDQIL